jgi:hypothetical protein
MKSILQDKKECFITGRTDSLHKHHVIGGPYRKKSEKWGLYIYLIPELHNMSSKGIHFDETFNLRMKMHAQRVFEEKYSHELWMHEFHKNYLTKGDEDGI